jgi:uncharacterized protein (TIGR03086 family)
MTNEPVSLLARALDQTGKVLAGVHRDQAGLPTPCRSWTVGQLVDHIVHDLRQFTAMASGGSADWSAPAAPAGEDWLGAYRKGADELLSTWRSAGDLSGTTELPGLGEVPARFPVDQQVAEFTVHAWDLNRATGSRVDLDPELAEAALGWMRTAMAPQFRGSEEDGKSFGPEVSVPDDAPPYDRLAAFAGRAVKGDRPGHPQ